MERRAYYNENDPYCAAWLHSLIAVGAIAHGDVDERSIVDVRPDDVRGYTQCHWFAGIGGWSYALRLAGWPDDRPVWTGSCPCQPFSAAGKGAGFDDERHLWPAWYWLITQCRPATIFGEQVSAKAALGWFDLVSTDLENSGYACGAADLCAASVGAPHIRQRLWFVADADQGQCRWLADGKGRERDGQAAERQQGNGIAQSGGHARELADATGTSASRQREHRRTASPNDLLIPIRSEYLPWSDADWLPCRDGKARPVEPGTFPLAHGIPGRVGRLRAYGNAIIPQVAAEFIAATYPASRR